MSRVIQRGVVGLCLIALLVLGSTFVGSQPGSAAPPPPQPQSIEGPEVFIRAGYTNRSIGTLSSPEFALATTKQGATITVNYSGTWSLEAQSAFQHAVDIWETQINSPVEIVVEATWTPLDTGVLGSARAATSYANFSNAPQANTWYAAATANALAGIDYNGSQPEIEARFNSNFPSWYFGTDGNPAGDEYDFVSVVLHEICHGLGFFGTMWEYQGVGYWGDSVYGYPAIYDRYAENGSGQALLSFSSGSTALGSQLVSGDIFFDGPYANAANQGARIELYAPDPWEWGSSYSHVATHYDGTVNALMTYSLYNGEAIHLPGPIVLGIFEDIGWHSPHPSGGCRNADFQRSRVEHHRRQHRRIRTCRNPSITQCKLTFIHALLSGVPDG